MGSINATTILTNTGFISGFISNLEIEDSRNRLIVSDQKILSSDRIILPNLSNDMNP